MSGLYLLICTESAPPIGSNNLLFYTEASWRSGAGLFLVNESLVWLSAANQIHLTKSVCPSINLFTCMFVQQPVHPPACPLVYCQSMSTVCFSVCPSGCMSDCLSFYHLVNCAFVGLAVGMSTCLSILKAGMHNREAEMTVHLSPPENNNEHFY